MKIVLGADDRGPTFDAVLDFLKDKKWDLDVLEVAQWPDVALRLADSVAAGTYDCGVLMCWTGTGTCMMANKVKGVRAALCWEPLIAEGARRYNDANVLVMSLKGTAPKDVPGILEAWFAVTGPDEDERPNIEKIAEYERSSDHSG